MGRDRPRSRTNICPITRYHCESLSSTPHHRDSEFGARPTKSTIPFSVAHNNPLLISSAVAFCTTHPVMSRYPANFALLSDVTTDRRMPWSSVNPQVTIVPEARFDIRVLRWKLGGSFDVRVRPYWVLAVDQRWYLMSHQCTALTKAGVQCERETEYRFCYLHIVRVT